MPQTGGKLDLRPQSPSSRYYRDRQIAFASSHLRHHRQQLGRQHPFPPSSAAGANGNIRDVPPLPPLLPLEATSLLLLLAPQWRITSPLFFFHPRTPSPLHCPHHHHYLLPPTRHSYSALLRWPSSQGESVANCTPCTPW